MRLGPSALNYLESGPLTGTLKRINIPDPDGVYELEVDATGTDLTFELRFNDDDGGVASYYSHADLTNTAGSGNTGAAWNGRINLGEAVGGPKRFTMKGSIYCQAGMVLRAVRYEWSQQDATPNGEKWEALGYWYNDRARVNNLKLVATSGRWGFGSKYSLALKKF